MEHLTMFSGDEVSEEGHDIWNALDSGFRNREFRAAKNKYSKLTEQTEK